MGARTRLYIPVGRARRAMSALSLCLRIAKEFWVQSIILSGALSFFLYNILTWLRLRICIYVFGEKSIDSSGAVYSFLKGFEIPINMSKFVYVCDFLNILLDEVFV